MHRMTGPVPAADSSSKKSASFTLSSFLPAAVPAVLVVLAILGFLYTQAQRETPPPVNFLSIVKVALRSPKRLAQDFADKNGDLVADAPEDEKLWLDPETLEFEVLGRDLQIETAQW